ncbi:MAG: serine/threonine-protein kinase [Ignavibacteriales bacterium]|nr:serine/threonine-protein kinase [Ignavibacteriales bacterium]
MVGTTISHYSILEKLGEGGMGVVYKAQDTKLNRTVALKFLPDHIASSEQDTARFTQEAQAAAGLSHPNICTIHGIEEADGKSFIVMEYVDGQTLQEKKSSLSMKQALDIGIQIAEGLAAAHEKGIIHRDIKPENIMIRKDGRVQIMDFGLAKLRGASRLTKEGSTVGTAGYMSPEQVQGQEIDHRSDIFSLGVLLYEMLTGQPPFKGVHETAIAYEVVNVDSPPMSSLKPEIVPELDTLVLECLEKDPNERAQSAKQIAIDLNRFKRTTSRTKMSRAIPAQSFADPHRISGFPRDLWKRLAGIAALAVLVGVGLGWVLFGEPVLPAVGVTRFSIPYYNIDSTREDGFRSFAISPDGSQLVYASAADDKLYVRAMNETHARLIQSVNGVVGWDVIYSPDSRWIAFPSRGKLVKQSVGGGIPITICDSGNQWYGSWTENNEVVFMKEWGSNLFIVSAEAGSTPRPLTTLNTQAGEQGHICPHTLPGGTFALFTIWTGASFEESLIAVVNLATGEHRVLIKGGTDGRYVETGHIVYGRGSTLMAIAFDLKTLQTHGEPVPVLEGVLSGGTSGVLEFSVSSNGTLVYEKGTVDFNATSINLFRLSDKRNWRVTSELNFGGPLFSPDGSRLCVTIYGPTFHLGTYGLRQGTLTPLTFVADNWRPIWNHDGSGMTFSSNLSGTYQMYSLAASGGGEPVILFEQSGNPYPLSWSHDGSALVYTLSGDQTGADIWLYVPGRTAAKRPLLNTNANEAWAKISPDGRWLAYVSDVSGGDEVYLQPFPSGTGKWRVSNGGGTEPKWSPDGKKIYYRRGDDIYSASITFRQIAAGISVTAGQPDRVHSSPGLNFFDLSPDGGSIVTDDRTLRLQRKELNVVLNWFSELNAKVPVQ